MAIVLYHGQEQNVPTVLEVNGEPSVPRIILAACLALGIALHARRRSCRKATEGLLSDGEEKDEEDPSYWRDLYQKS